MRGKRAPNQRAYNRGQTEDGPEKSLDFGTLLERNCIDDAYHLDRQHLHFQGNWITHRSSKDPRGSNTSESSANNESRGVGRSSANDRANFEQQDATQHNCFHGVEGVDLSE